MASLTLSIPEELREKMKDHPEINWSEVARQAILKKTRLLEKMNQILSEGYLSDEEIPGLTNNIKKEVWKKHRG